MNKTQKKALYESIMKGVSKTIKRRLNEDQSYEDYAYNINACLDETGDERLKEEVLNNIHMMLTEIRMMVDQLNDGDISYEEVLKTFSKIDIMTCGDYNP